MHDPTNRPAAGRSTYRRRTYTHQEDVAAEARSPRMSSSLPTWAVQSLITRTVTIRNRVFPLFSEMRKGATTTSPPAMPSSLGSRRSSAGEIDRNENQEMFQNDTRELVPTTAVDGPAARDAQSGVDWRWGQQGACLPTLIKSAKMCLSCVLLH